MAAPGRRKNLTVGEYLRKHPHDFDFFQAVRMLEHVARMRSESEPEYDRRPVGRDESPRREVVRFRTPATHSFPAGEIASLEATGGNGQLDDHDSQPPLMTVAFMGLTGPSGVLPRHYTQLMIDRARHKDYALQSFFDLFNHRVVSLFYRAWEKYRFPYAYERAARSEEPQQEDVFTRSLYSLVGFGFGTLRRRMEYADETILYYSGHFSHQPRNAIGLKLTVADYFGIATEVLQFHGQWLKIEPADQSRLPTRSSLGGNNRLGENVVVGERVWSVESKFRIRLGPVNYQGFRQFTPTGQSLVVLCQLARTYVGSELDFDVQPILLASEIPQSKLDSRSKDPAHLGWNTWLISRTPESNADDAVFQHEGYPVA
jgi:type VI secretion system protein ImpH